VVTADFISKFKRGISQYCVKKNLEQASIPEKYVKSLVHQNIKFDCMEQDSVSNAQSYVISVKSDAAFHHATSKCRDRSRIAADLSKRVKEGVGSRLAIGIPLAGFFGGFIVGLIVILFSQNELYHTIIAEIILTGVLTGVTITTITEHIRGFNFNVLIELFIATTIVVLILVCLTTVIALVENLIGAIAGATVGACCRAVTAGVISGAASICITNSENHIAYVDTLILSVASVLFLNQVLFGKYILIALLSIIAATAGAVVGAAIHARSIGYVIKASNEDISNMVVVNSIGTAFGAFIGASMGALTGIAIISGAIIGSIVGAIISEADINSAVLVETCIAIEPYSISSRTIARFIRIALKILGPVASIINRIIGFITSRRSRTAVFGVVGSIIGAVIGAYTEFIGGACAGVIIAEYTSGMLSIISINYRKNFESDSDTEPNSETDPMSASGKDINTNIITKFHKSFSSPIYRRIGIISKSIREANEIAVPLILPGIIDTMILSTVCALTSSYFTTSALIGKFGPYVSHFFGNVIALSEVITGNTNIAISGFSGGLLGGIAVGIYIYYIAPNDLCLTEFEVCALGVIGTIFGFITARVDETIGNALLIPIGGAALGAFSGLLGGALLVIVKVPMEILIKSAVTKFGGMVVTVTAVIGGFIGGILGGYLSFGAIFTGLLGITFSVTSIVFLTATISVRQTRDICIPLKDIIVLFGEAIRSKSDQGNAANNSRVQYKIKCQILRKGNVEIDKHHVQSCM
jgi:hypothetical protein